MSPSIRELLHRFDEAGAYEFPSQFDYPDLERRARAVLADLESAGLEGKFEGAVHNQDASFSVAILLLSFQQSQGNMQWGPTLRFSNFGNLVTVTFAEELPELILPQLLESIQRHGFTYVSADELDCPYDGVMSNRSTFRSWWVRYFDWL
jgi:hypothetical protein